jgi:hypothetical protein
MLPFGVSFPSSSGHRPAQNGADLPSVARFIPADALMKKGMKCTHR